MTVQNIFFSQNGKNIYLWCLHLCVVTNRESSVDVHLNNNYCFRCLPYVDAKNLDRCIRQFDDSPLKFPHFGKRLKIIENDFFFRRLGHFQFLTLKIVGNSGSVLALAKIKLSNKA